MPITFGCSVPTRGPLASPDTLKKLTLTAEAAGYESVWVSDHLILPRSVGSFYPYGKDGIATFLPDEDYFEPLAALTYLAGCTSKIKLGTHVLILPYRHPVLTAKLLSTLDVLSKGRVILGAGVGWMEEEFDALGLDTYAQRGKVTDEYIQLFKELWTQSNPEFQGNHYKISDVGFAPKPVQKPHPPIWIGGHTAPAIRRAAKFGDGWLPIGQKPPAILEPAEFSVKIDQLRKLTLQAGREEKQVALCFSTTVRFTAGGSSRQKMQGTPGEIASDLRPYKDLGVENFVVGFEAETVNALEDAIGRFKEDVIPSILG
ncbi:LLM class F420-dependent oxidoreductase [SAR202 cluster bacterium AD-804-J14_MRT_500m]|nr:LLM class F420-dependent oxidoreductase [SAR202 cluster bacterium AD-804-J14_MRT_500m]